MTRTERSDSSTPIRRSFEGAGRAPRPRPAASKTLVGFLICLALAGCGYSPGPVERLFSYLPERTYESIECSSLVVTRRLLGLPAIDHRSPAKVKSDWLTRMSRFTFSTGEYSFLVSDATPLGFDPSDFSMSIVARTPSYAITVVSGDFDTKTILKRLSAAGYRSQAYRDHTLYCLPASDAPPAGGLSVAFANLTFVGDDVIASAPTEELLRDYLDRIAVGTLADDATILGLVEQLKGESSFYISRSVGFDELYGENSLFIRNPEDWGLPGYRLSPYTYFAFGIRPAADKKRQQVTLLILYPDDGSAENDVAALSRGLEKGKSLSRLVPFSELFTVAGVTAKGTILAAQLESKDDFDVKSLIRLRDLPFLVY